MKYGFVRLKNDDGSRVFMEISDFQRYKDKDIFKNHAEALVIFDNIYIGMFPLMFEEDEIYKYNFDAKLFVELPLKDICFKYSGVAEVAKILGCEN